jgi:hypothetical protein
MRADPRAGGFGDGGAVGDGRSRPAGRACVRSPGAMRAHPDQEAFMAERIGGRCRPPCLCQGRPARCACIASHSGADRRWPVSSLRPPLCQGRPARCAHRKPEAVGHDGADRWWPVSSSRPRLCQGRPARCARIPSWRLSAMAGALAPAGVVLRAARVSRSGGAMRASQTGSLRPWRSGSAPAGVVSQPARMLGRTPCAPPKQGALDHGSGSAPVSSARRRLC